MRIRDVLEHKGAEVLTIDAGSTTLDAVKKLNEKHVGSLIVVDDDARMVGFLSERDILANFAESARGIPVTQVMTPRDQLYIVHEDDDIQYAMNVMTEHRIRHLPVFEDKRLVGLVSIGDLMKAVTDSLEFETKQLNEYIAGSYVVVP